MLAHAHCPSACAVNCPGGVAICCIINLLPSVGSRACRDEIVSRVFLLHWTFMIETRVIGPILSQEQHDGAQREGGLHFVIDSAFLI